MWFSKSLVLARATTLSTLSKNLETLSLTCMQGDTAYLAILLANLLSVFTVSTTRTSLNASGDPLSSIVHLGTEPNAIFKSRSNWTPVNLKSRKRESMIIPRISAGLFLVQQWRKSRRLSSSLRGDSGSCQPQPPVGQCASKLHLELKQMPVSLVSTTKSKVHAVQLLVLLTTGEKVFKLHGIELDKGWYFFPT